MISILKLKIKVAKRLFGAIFTGQYLRFGLNLVKKQDGDWQEKTTINLPIFDSPLREGKLHNLRIAIEKINGRVLLPGKIFSFWYEIGEPSLSKGYKEGRVIRNGVVSSEIAGGLCQLSGIIYYLSLELGLSILERFPHSRDLYTEETRFTPLGTDASVVYPTKDLRIQNTFPFPLLFHWELTDSNLTFCIEAKEPLKRRKLNFQQTKKNGFSNVKVFLESDEDGKSLLCSSDDYLL
ncbi:VanW family protein [Leptospira vanthielii]|uniref:VanW-like protein n=1 Tax=Leptospira vanthielii serovar Holland str. Waz Holland = ATCC 700522 TaxID=1218591 RepID=N1WJ75_9LEPT|nr:VanW family protein [Leptospira vanthielii]EMY71936.1 VanW-like protein [Leptospira vanthielii serovar Holland str. Waz Holland = ATCC 700522]